jgi:hypothetical protein
MIITKYSLCAETIVVDKATNAISVINLFDDLIPEGYPFLFPKITFLVVIHKEASDKGVYDGTVKITINGKELFSASTKVDFLEKDLYRFIWGVGGLVIPEPGILKFELLGVTDPSPFYQLEFQAIKPKELQPLV